MTDLASICSSNKELVQGCSKKKKKERKKTPQNISIATTQVFISKASLTIIAYLHLEQKRRNYN